jgi:hypothetical protein
MKKNLFLMIAAVSIAFAGCQKNEPKSTSCEIVSFTVDGTPWDISGTEISYTFPSEMEATALSPVITLSPGATVNPPSGAAMDLFTPEGVAYTVTAEDRLTTKTYIAKAEIEAVASGATGACTWAITGPAGNYTLTIAGAGAMGNYSTFGQNYAPWYEYREGITTLVVRDGVTTIGDGAFDGCPAFIGALTIPNSVASIGHRAFINTGFSGALILPDALTSIAYGAFWNCTGFTGTLTIPDAVASIGDLAFSGCTGFTGTLILPDALTSISAETFRSCTGLTGVVIPASVTSIGGYSFIGCTGLTGTLTIPGSVTSIGDFAFYNCYGLTGTLTIPDAVVSIGRCAFESCRGLTSLTIPTSVASIGDSAFRSCVGLTSMTNLNPVPRGISGNVFDDVPVSAITLRVPAGAVTAYQGAEIWRDFGSIVAIP